jgi:hypothetical protein
MDFLRRLESPYCFDFQGYRFILNIETGRLYVSLAIKLMYTKFRHSKKVTRVSEFLSILSYLSSIIFFISLLLLEFSSGSQIAYYI